MEEARLTITQRREIGSRMLAEAPILPRARSAPRQNSGNLFDLKRNYHFFKRNLQQIKDSGAFEEDVYRPSRNYCDRIKEKGDLQNIMAYGKKSLKRNGHIQMKNRTPKILTKHMRLEEIREEIGDRTRFLAEMSALGHRARYENMIKQEIAAKMREFDVVERMTDADFNAISLEAK